MGHRHGTVKPSAEIVVLATGLAEFVGAAISMQLLFGMPAAVSAVLTAVGSLLLLEMRRGGHSRRFELVSAAALLPRRGQKGPWPAATPARGPLMRFSLRQPSDSDDGM